MIKSFFVIALLTITQFVFSQAPKIISFSPDSAGQYGVVNIRGEHLASVTNVTFGGITSGYFFASSDTTMYAYCGPAKSGYVAVYNSNGKDSLAGFTYMEAPQFYSFFPNSGKYGDTITIKGKNFYNMINIDFGDSSSFSFKVLNDSLIKAVVGNGSFGEVYGYGDFGDTYLDGFIYLGPSITSFSPTAGTTGMLINITGNNFTGTTKVSFGGIPAASFVVSSNTQIAAKIGAGGAGNIAVTTPLGTATAPHFNSPYINDVEPTWGTRYDTVRITGYNFTGATSVSFGDSLAIYFKVVSDGLIQAVVGNGGTGHIKVSRDSLSFTTVFTTFYYNSYIPVIKSFAPTTATDQTQVIITGDQFIGTSAVSFGGYPADSFFVVSNTIIRATVGAGGSGSVSVTNNNFKDSMAGFIYVVTPPTITDFSPAVGPLGSLITITGKGFNNTVSGNVVYIGGVKATVTSASRNTLTVSVPPGAGYLPVSVTNNGFTGYSRRPFNITFPGAPASFSTNSFDLPLTLRTAGSNPQKMTQGDFDNDGKIDIAIVYGYFGSNNNTVSVYRNTGGNGAVAFAAPLEYTIGNQGYSGFDIATADIDGDGKQDLLALSTGDNIVGIFKNTSTKGKISFAPKTDFITGNPNGPDGTNPRDITVADFDGDGKPDLAVASFGLDNWCKVTYMRNTSANGNISFAAREDYPVTDAYTVSAGHLNNDNKPDLAVGINVNLSGMQEVGILNNQSTNGAISFQRNEDTGPSNTLKPSKIAFSDIDADGKIDMVVANGNGSSVSVYKNTTTDSSNITFNPPIHLTAGSAKGGVMGLSIADADGDGKPDLMTTSAADSIFSIFKNLSSVNNISFAPAQNLTTRYNPADIMAVDLNGDGKPDIVTANNGDTSISIFRNSIGGTVKLCPPVASPALNAGISGSSYQWQVNTGNNIFNNITNGGFYSGATTNTLQLIAVPSSFSGYQYRCFSDSKYSNIFSLQFVDSWIGATNASWNNPGNWSCGAVPDANSDVIIASGNVILNSNGTCRTITILEGASLTVNSGFKLTVTH